MKKTSRVVDESFVGGEIGRRPSRSRWSDGLLSGIVCGIVRVSFTLLSCISQHPNISGTDGMWVSAELTQTSELNHLVVRDSMRYAILM
ncbi:hypothetical protein F511_05449 [Dorcoceras hygrometricum]|uniref:Uncharacterized protein n=1 Tax=Dorcoceras hygrometricum TaxID=472368 RepID=A0A2Z7BBA0_9LAMI|nr:hypothetical protein F511_05449 [Dorcoceras hygrometricum]